MQQHSRDPCALESAAAATDEVELAPCTGSRVVQSHAKRPREPSDVCIVLKPNVSSSAHISVVLICSLLALLLPRAKFNLQTISTLQHHTAQCALSAS
jgi:hypothetical protein